MDFKLTYSPDKTLKETKFVSQPIHELREKENFDCSNFAVAKTNEAVSKTLDKVVDHLNFITKNLQILEMRMANNEEQISRLNLVFNNEFKNIEPLTRQVYDLNMQE